MIKFLYRLLTGEYFNLYVGGGSPAPAQQPTQQTVTQTNLPAWAQPYSEQLLGKAQALTDTNTNPYQSYTGDRLAGFTPMQQQAFQNIGGMQVSPQTGQATGLAGLAGMGSLGAGANYMNMATNPAAIQAFMSPYQQNVTDWQKQQAISDYGRQLPGLGAGASQAGAFGGTRHALVESEAQRNLQNQLAGIQAQGSQNAFNAAQQAQQFGAGLGLQGYGQALQGAQTLGQLGQQQYQQQMGINAAQQQAGAQQQAMNQQQLTNQYQDFLNRQNYPYQQLSFMSDILHGTPTGGITTAQTYQAAPSMFSQIAGLGMGLGALGKGFGMFKEGGEIKGYKGGGKVGYADGGLPQLAGMDVNMADPTTELGVKSQLQKAQMGQQPIVPLQTLMALQKGIQQLHTPAAQPQTTTVAQDLAKQVLAQSEPGVAGLPTDKNMFTAANGGIVAFDDGGKVDPYNIASGETWLGQGIQRGKAALKDLTGILTLQPWQTDPKRVARGDYRTNAEVEGYTPSSYAVNERADELRKRLAQQGVAAAQPVPPATRQFDPMNPWARVGLPAAQTAQTPPATGIPSTLTAADYEDQRPYPGVKSVAPAPAPARTVAAPTVKAPVATPTTPTVPAMSDEQKTLHDKLMALTKPETVDPEAARQATLERLNKVAPSNASEIREFYKAEGERLRSEGDKDRWLALAMGGFAVAAGKSPYAIQNFGEGLGLAAKEVAAVNKDLRAAEAARSKAERAELQADRAQELGKTEAAEKRRSEVEKYNMEAKKLSTSAANVLSDSFDRRATITSQENIHAMDRASRERVARMEAGTRNQTNALLNEYNARILRGDKAGAEALLPSIQAISEATGKGAAQQRALTAQQKVQLDAAKASVKSLDEQILFEKDKTRKQTLIDQRDRAMRTISNLEGGAEGGGSMGGGFDLSAIKAELDKRGAR